MEHTTGKVLSDSTVLRLLKRMGFSQKTDSCGGGGARRVAESRLEGGACLENRPEAARLLKEEMGTNTSLSVLRAWSRRGQRAYCSVPRNRGPNTTLLSSMTTEGMGPSLAVEGTTTGAVFEAYSSGFCTPCCALGRSW